MPSEKKKKFERGEALWRILVAIVSGIILDIWMTLNFILAVINWFIVIFTGERNKEIAEFCEIGNTQLYIYARYVTFVSNKRPFPFEKVEKNLSKYEK